MWIVYRYPDVRTGTGARAQTLTVGHPEATENAFGSPLLHPLRAGRSRPTSFDASYDVPDFQVEALVEAARWAPSAGNSSYELVGGVMGGSLSGTAGPANKKSSRQGHVDAPVFLLR